MNHIVCEAGKTNTVASFMNPIPMVKNLCRYRDVIKQFAWRDFVSAQKGSLSRGILVVHIAVYDGGCLRFCHQRDL
jgi:hypothetical protein